ncbi:MAG: hypothetical protein QHH26_04040 [Armatimonadota bacterium]|nr:hypothetical protein [Armatimonadota bacterium]
MVGVETGIPQLLSGFVWFKVPKKIDLPVNDKIKRHTAEVAGESSILSAPSSDPGMRNFSRETTYANISRLMLSNGVKACIEELFGLVYRSWQRSSPKFKGGPPSRIAVEPARAMRSDCQGYQRRMEPRLARYQPRR